MRFMMFVKADETTEAGVLPSRTDLEIMGKFNEELMKAGVLLDGAGLQPSAKGAKITFVNGKPQVTDGPFAETKEQLGGYYILECDNLDEAIDFARRIPPCSGSGCIEIRPIQVLPEPMAAAATGKAHA